MSLLRKNIISLILPNPHQALIKVLGTGTNASLFVEPSAKINIGFDTKTKS